jgi:prepilin-type N-terminal cleavage/methylation domain-containing protein
MREMFLPELIVITNRLNKIKDIKGFSLLEILVVVALIGIVGIFVVPNVKDWMSRKELRNDFFTIHKMVTKMRTEVELGVYPMGGIFLDNNAGNGIIVKVRYRNPDKFRTYKNSCEDIDSQWDGVETITSQTNADIYAKFANLRLSQSKISTCLSRAGYSNFSVNFHVCHKKQNPNILCDIKDPQPLSINNNSPFYESYFMGINRMGHNFLRYFVYKNGTRMSWENL